MNLKLLLTKCISLLYRQSQLDVKDSISRDLILTTLDKIPIPETGIGSNIDKTILIDLRNTVIDMCNNPPDSEYEKDILLQHIRIVVGHDDRLYEAILQGIDKEIPENKLKKIVVEHRETIGDFFRDSKINEILDKASNMFKNNRSKIKDVGTFIQDLKLQLEPLQKMNNGKDKAIISEIFLGDTHSVNAAFKRAKAFNDTNGLIKTGWVRLNHVLEGGFRRGECVLISGLAHRNKTGFTLSLFKQFAIYNKPYMIDIRKKPLLVRISFEDETDSNMRYLYTNLKYNKERKFVTIDNETSEYLSGYVTNELQINGYHLLVMKVNGDEWEYRKLFNFIIHLESLGYEVHMVMEDYMNKMSKTGCDCLGGTGSDTKDLLQKHRNFFNPRKILYITPHQYGPEAKALIRSVPEYNFLREAAGKGYYENCKSLDQIADVDLSIHTFSYINGHNKDYYLNVGLNKHRDFVMPDEDERFFYYKYPKNKMPIPDDLLIGDSSLKKLISSSASVTEITKTEI